MLKPSARSAIRLRGVRQNNLKNFDLDLPLNQLIVVTGLSGSGKSSLAFDTLFAEGQRRYIETFSPYARQFLDRMDKPQVDSIEGIPPAIAIEQRNSVKTTRSTVGTVTEICDYMKTLWPHVAQLHCRQCGLPVRKDSPQQIWNTLCGSETRNPELGINGKNGKNHTGSCGSPAEVLVTFELPLSEKLSLKDSLGLVAKQGYQRLLVKGEMLRLEEASTCLAHHTRRTSLLIVIQDRLKLTGSNRARFVEACEQAYHFGKGKLTIWQFQSTSAISDPHLFSNRLHCAQCDIEYREPSPALFSFNNPVGACTKCRGFGRVISIDYSLVMPDRSRTLAQGVVKPWLTGTGFESQRDLLRMCRHFEIPINVPFEKLTKKWQDFVINGEPDYGIDEEHQWPRAWYGVKGYFRWLESKAYKMHVRVLLSRYRAYTPCPDCHGNRFQPEALLYRIQPDVVSPKSRVQSPESRVRLRPSAVDSQATEPGRPRPVDCGLQPADCGLTLADFYRLPIRDALDFIEELRGRFQRSANDPLGLALNEVRSRLGYLAQVGLGYLTLDRPTRSLSGGETERVNLTTCLGTRLVNTLFVLDEPSVGLHPRDTERLVCILEQLRDAGNTVLVVEHEASVIRAADRIIDIGPGHGATGGEVVFQGTYEQILQSHDSLTGRYLSGRNEIEVPERRFVRSSAAQLSRVLPYDAPRFDTLVLRDAPAKAASKPNACPALKLTHATRHNLKDLTVEIPLGRFVCITGVSGSGKSTLMLHVLLPTLSAALKSALPGSKASERMPSETSGEGNNNDALGENIPSAASATVLIEGGESLQRVILVDQSILGKTPRSNPAVYIGAFDDIREFFAQSDLARQRGLNASAFSFNSSQGQCERCRGAGFEKIEMQFLSDIFIRCPDCNGRRYRAHILEVKIGETGGRRQETGGRNQKSLTRSRRSSGIQQPISAIQYPVSSIQHPVSSIQFSALSIADLLESTVEEAIEFLSAFSESRPARHAVQSLKLLQEVGLGYLKLGQPINTLSGGESQRLKLVRHLAETLGADHDEGRTAGERQRGADAREPRLTNGSAETYTGRLALKATLFLFDEPTTGLHFDDVRVLLRVFQRLVNAGHSVVVIEHNLEVIKSADWLIDLGPDAGDEGGNIVAQGTPEEVALCEQSHTGRALRVVLQANALLEQLNHQ